MLQVKGSPIFWIISVLGLVGVIFIMLKVTVLEDFVLVPATQFMIGTPLIIYSMVITLITFVYVGMSVHRESHSGMSQLLEATPVPGFVILLGKVIGIIIIQLLMLVLFVAASIVFQFISGYTTFDFRLYSYSVFVQAFIPLITWALTSFFVHITIRNLYLSIFILLIGWMGINGLSSIGITTYLIRFNELPRLLYSEFNGFGFLETSFFMVAFYWLSFGIFLMLLGIFIYRMDDVLSWKDRLKGFASQLHWKALVLLALPLALMGILGNRIYQGEGQKFSTTRQTIEFEKFKNDFERFSKLPQPRIASLHAAIDLYPQLRAFECTGYYNIVNASDSSLDTLLIKSGFDEVTEIHLDAQHDLLLENAFMKVRLIKLKKPLVPGDSLRLNFTIKSKPNSLFEHNSNVLTNGTYLQHDIFPRLGYSFSEELPLPSDPNAKHRHYQSHD
ncbi:MAG: hypothetical protein RIA63_04565, partial [Cyclobacteriaceae bacterium]